MFVHTVRCSAIGFVVLSFIAVHAAEGIGWRGDGTGIYPNVSPPSEWSKPAAGPSKNILWQTRMPGRGISSAIVVGDRVYTTAEYDDLVCVDRKSGKVIWIRSHHYYDGMTSEQVDAHSGLRERAEPLAKQCAELNDTIVKAINDGAITDEMLEHKRSVEHDLYTALAAFDKALSVPWEFNYKQGWGISVPTPCSDGEHVFACFGNGVVVCYNKDGQRVWIRNAIPNGPALHQYTISPICVGHTLVVMHKNLIALDAETGKQLWTQGPFPIEPTTFEWVYGSLNSYRAKDGQDVVVAANGSFVRLSDGKQFYFGNWKYVFVTPTLADGALYHIYKTMNNDKFKGPIAAMKLPEKTDEIITKAAGEQWILPAFETYPFPDKAPSQVSSLLIHDKLLYSIDNLTVLRVWDLESRKLCYSESLKPESKLPSMQGYIGAPGQGASPAWAGGNIYIGGNTGTFWVLKPGREFKLLSTNTIAQKNPKEFFGSNLAFDGSEIFVRSTDYLYGIGSRTDK
jgi:outer membrane protein assembly factor BamB